MGVDAVEPDIVATRDGVLVVRHENEISGTTNVAELAQFADRRTTKVVDGERLTGWFTEDFTWAELTRITARERIPELRPASATFNDREGILRLTDLLTLVAEASAEFARDIAVVVEIKHATYFASLGVDLAALLLRDLRACGWADGTRGLIIESFEQGVLTQLQEAGLQATYIYLMEADGVAADLQVGRGDAAPTYEQQRSAQGLDQLATQVDGISVSKRVILDPDRLGRARGPSRIVQAAHDRGLLVYTWTARPENAFLVREFRTGPKPHFGNYEAEWAILQAANVDGVFVDHPDLGVDFFRA